MATAATIRPEFSSQLLLEHILANEYDALDPTTLSKSIAALKRRNAHRCWHKHSTFLEHLLNVHNILRLWGQGAVIARVGLFHSAYSNSYVNLALFNPEQERNFMRELIGEEAEELVYLFCSINRQEVVVNTLLRLGYIPKEGLHVPHIRNPGETVYLSPEVLRMLVVFTMADTADQHFSWQDSLFGGGGEKGSMIIPGYDHLDRHDSRALWPGISKPGLFMSYISSLGSVAKTFDPSSRCDVASDLRMDVPPIFKNCTALLSVEDEAIARDLYWSVVMEDIHEEDEIIATLRLCHEKNPYAFEPLVILAQKYLHRNDFDSALTLFQDALELQQQWGTCWDKRMSLGAWIAWTRVMHQKAKERDPWSDNSWDVNNLGFVK